MKWAIAPGPFLWGARQDLVVFGFSFALPLMLVLLAQVHGLPNQELPEWAFLAFVIGVDVAHVYATLFRTYLDREELARHRLRYFGLPVVAFLVGVWAWSLSPLTLFRGLAYLAVLHFVRQQAGWVALYRARSEDRSLRTRYIDQAAIYLATLYPLFFWHVAPGSRRFAWFMAGDFVSWSELSWLLPWVQACWALALSLFVMRQVYELYRKRRVELGKSLVVLGTALTWYVGIVATNGDFEFTVTNVLPHGVPYLALLWFYARARRAEAPGLVGSRIVGAGLIAFLATCLAIAGVEEALWDRWVWHDHVGIFGQGSPLASGILNLAAPLLVVPQAVHYVLDGVLWRRKDTRARQAQRTALGYAPRET